MVREYGMSAALGPVGFRTGESTYPGGQELSSRPYAEATQRVIDEEVGKLLHDAEQCAITLLIDHRELLDRLTALLLERETVDGSDVQRLLAASLPVPGSGYPQIRASRDEIRAGEGKAGRCPETVLSTRSDT